MKPLTTQQPSDTSIDPDLAEQARPGHGVPSQDPAPEAQFPLVPEERERESKSVFTGGGALVGAATGAAVGMAVAGPVGVLVGGTVGVVAGALGGAAAGELMDTEDPFGADSPSADERPARGDGKG